MEIAIGRAGDRDLHIDAQELVTGRTCVIAQSGAGKSWGIAVLCERLCRSYIGFCLIDTEGEYFSLKDRFPILWIGADPACDEDIMKADIREIMRQAILCSTPVVFDVSEVDMRERANALANILYDLESELRKPYLLIVEEADKFIPQSKDSIKKIEEISRRGRKRGLGLLVATQRPSLVVKNVLSQCNSQIIGKLSIDNDLKAVAHFFNSRREVEELIDLEPGEFFVMGGITREKVKMKFGDRETMHRGLTPRLVPGEPPAREAVPEIPCPPPPAEPPAPEVRPAPLPDLRQKPENAIVAELQREEALEIARGRCRRSLLTRTPLERIASVELVFWPLLHAEVKYLGGMLRKTTKTASFIVDGLQGNGVDVNYGLAIRPGFRELI
ncbi:MAG: ATP-binding protein, partial [Methanomicrobiaceae archaeon]|nr:ATP-binding protein [Methanomicrobiaceae archaeon]